MSVYVRRLLPVLAAATGLLVAVASSAHAEIFWGDPFSGTVSSAQNSGHDLVENVVTGGNNVSGVAADDQHLYWANYNTSTIGRSASDGFGAVQDFLTNVPSASGLTIAGAHLYWTEDGPGQIGRANLDGSDVTHTLVTGLSSPESVTTFGGKLYWTNTGTNTIGRANLDGSESDPAFISGAQRPYGVAVNPSGVFWTNYMDRTIGHADLGGRVVSVSRVPGDGVLAGIATDDTFLYWADLQQHRIGRARSDGMDVEPDFLSTGATLPYGLTVRLVPPVVSAVSPVSGATSGGTAVTVSGSGFAAAASVSIGGVACTPVLVSSDQRSLTCTTGAHAPGTVAGRVVNPVSGSSAAFPFTYTAPAARARQVPAGKCVTVPSRVPVRGSVQLMAARCRTNAGRRVHVRVSTGVATRGDVSFFSVYRSKSGATRLRVRGPRSLLLRVSWRAGSVPGYRAYARTALYRTGR